MPDRFPGVTRNTCSLHFAPFRTARVYVDKAKLLTWYLLRVTGLTGLLALKLVLLRLDLGLSCSVPGICVFTAHTYIPPRATAFCRVLLPTTCTQQKPPSNLPNTNKASDHHPIALTLSVWPCPASLNAPVHRAAFCDTLSRPPVSANTPSRPYTSKSAAGNSNNAYINTQQQSTSPARMAFAVPGMYPNNQSLQECDQQAGHVFHACRLSVPRPISYLKSPPPAPKATLTPKPTHTHTLARPLTTFLPNRAPATFAKHRRTRNRYLIRQPLLKQPLSQPRRLSRPPQCLAQELRYHTEQNVAQSLPRRLRIPTRSAN